MGCGVETPYWCGPPQKGKFDIGFGEIVKKKLPHKPLRCVGENCCEKKGVWEKKGLEKKLVVEMVNPKGVFFFGLRNEKENEPLAPFVWGVVNPRGLEKKEKRPSLLFEECGQKYGKESV